MKDFLYLVQGRSDLVEKYQFLDNKNNSEAIFLTYDKQIANSIFLPNSTWAEGRNFLFEKAIMRENYRYYIFCDDDIKFKKGGWDKFENNLLTIQPGIAVPVFLEKTKATPLRLLKYNSILYNDEQMIAFHKDVINDGIVMPLQNQFDDLHWWASCRIQQILIQNFYPKDIIQVNNVHITNDVHDRYPKQNEFMKHIHSWLSNEFLGKYNNIKMSIKKNFHIIIWRTIINYFVNHCSRKRADHSLSEKILRKKLSSESKILNQYLHYSSNQFNINSGF